MGSKCGYAHATRHCNRNADTGIHYFPNHHKTSDSYPNCNEYSYLYNDCDQCTNLHSDSHLRISHHATNCYRYHHRFPHFNSYPYPCSLTVQTLLPSGA